MKTHMKTKIGLREIIAQAKTPAEINDLLVIGTQLENASEHMKRRWQNTAARRLKELASK